MRKFSICLAFLALFILFFVKTTKAKTGDRQLARKQKIQALYDTLVANHVIYPVTITAIAILETGFLECKKCPLRYNNFMGFRFKRYLKFKSMGHTVNYINKWHSQRYYVWKARNPKKNYHQFLKHIHYAANMKLFMKHLKRYEHWVKRNIDINRNPYLYACEGDTLGLDSLKILGVGQ